MKLKERVQPIHEVRKQNCVPGVIYGKGIESTPIQTEYLELMKAYRKYGVNMTFEINLNKEKHLVYIKEIQKSLSNNSKINHFDLIKLSSDDTITSKIPLVFHGKEAVSETGLVLFINLNDLDVEYSVTSGVAQIEIDLTNVEFNKPFLVKDVVVTEGIKILNDLEQTVCSFLEPMKEEVVEVELDEEAEGAEDVEGTEGAEETDVTEE